MPEEVTVQQIGGSKMVTIPAWLARRLDIEEGDKLKPDFFDGMIVFKPQKEQHK